MIKSYKFRRRIANFFIYLLLAILGIIWVSPFVYLVMHSFRAESMTTVPYLIPHEWTFDNYIKLFTSAGSSSINFPRWFINTFVVAIFSCIISTISVLAVSYTFSRLRFGARKKLMNVAMILGMFPGFMSMIAVYYILKGLGFLETGVLKQVALVLVYSGGAGLGFYMAKGFFDMIPRTIDEAAYIDGATKWDTFIHITIPMSKPIITYTLLTAFMGPWTDYIFAKVIMGSDTEYYTIAIGLWTMLEKEYIEYYYTQFYAGCVLISIPIAILFMLTQSCYVEGVSGAVKG